MESLADLPNDVVKDLYKTVAKLKHEDYKKEGLAMGGTPAMRKHIYERTDEDIKNGKFGIPKEDVIDGIRKTFDTMFEDCCIKVYREVIREQRRSFDDKVGSTIYREMSVFTQGDLTYSVYTNVYKNHITTLLFEKCGERVSPGSGATFEMFGDKVFQYTAETMYRSEKAIVIAKSLSTIGFIQTPLLRRALRNKSRIYYNDCRGLKVYQSVE